MRHIKVYAAIMLCPLISHRAKILYTCLKSFASEVSKRVWPSQETLAKHMNCTTRTVRESLYELVHWEIIPGNWEQWDAAASNTYYLTDESAAAKIMRNAGSTLPYQWGSGLPANKTHSKDSLKENPGQYGEASA